VPFLFQIALLDRRQGMIDDDEAGIMRVEQAGDLDDLAGTEQRGGLRLADADQDRIDDRQLDGCGQAACLFQARLVRACRSGRIALVAPLAALSLDDGHEHESARFIAALTLVRNRIRSVFVEMFYG
jgi:hypothetical protein